MEEKTSKDASTENDLESPEENVMERSRLVCNFTFAYDCVITYDIALNYKYLL